MQSTKTSKSTINQTFLQSTNPKQQPKSMSNNKQPKPPIANNQPNKPTPKFPANRIKQIQQTNNPQQPQTHPQTQTNKNNMQNNCTKLTAPSKQCQKTKSQKPKQEVQT